MDAEEGTAGEVISEGKAKIRLCEGVFFNPYMELCRTLSSLCLGAVAAKKAVDCFCATGVRGIRYALENNCEVEFCDIDRRAVDCTRANLSLNGLEGEVHQGNISRLAFSLRGDFVEIDPFGTPAPYLIDAFRIIKGLKTAFLSITATDTAVLCGGKKRACMKNYHALPLNNMFTHEVGTRILIKRVAEVASEFNRGIEPLFSFSHRHYIKIIVKTERGAERAMESLQKCGFLVWCKVHGVRWGEYPALCCKDGQRAGPLWLGELHKSEVLQGMAGKGGERERRILSLMEGEMGLPPYYIDLHKLSKIACQHFVVSVNDALEKLREQGYRAFKTHFSPRAIKTDAPLKEVVQCLY